MGVNRSKLLEATSSRPRSIAYARPNDPPAANVETRAYRSRPRTRSPRPEHQRWCARALTSVFSSERADRRTEAMYYCLGSLYSPPTPDGLHAGNARAILAAALFFGLEGAPTALGLGASIQND